MKPLSIRLLLMLTGLVFLGECQARAEMIPFSYHWDVLPSTVIPGLPGSTGSVQVAPAQNGTTTPFLVGAVPGTTIPGATITTNSSATNPADSFNANYSMKLTLMDAASNTSGSLTFAGTIAGSLTATSSSLTSTFHNPLTQTLTLGSHVYSVTIDPTKITLPAPGASALALIDAIVSATDKGTGTGTGTGTGPSAPEPSSLVLGAAALFGLSLRRLARQRSKRVPS